MGSVDRIEDRTFKVNFTVEGVNNLREKVKNKLKEFMGDYTDDTLVEYVIVLLRNGRQKEEARSELQVFLGDDSDSFVSWLWDHLASNLDLYVQAQVTNGGDKTKPTKGDQEGMNGSHSGSGKGKSDNLPSRHRREWKALMRYSNEPPPLRGSEVDNMQVEKRHDYKVNRARRSPSPQPSQQRKRSRPEERQDFKREAASQATINAPRRLLQFAVRDAVGTSRPSGLIKEPSVKRLRSVVSTPTLESSSVDRPRRIQSIARVPIPMATVIRAVQEAAEDVAKVKPSRNVFDRLGGGMEISETTEPIGDIRDDVRDEGYEEFDPYPDQAPSIYLPRHEYVDHGYVEHEENIDIMERETVLADNSIFDNDVYDENDMARGVMNVAETGTSGGNKSEDSYMLQYNASRNADLRGLIRNNRQIPTSNCFSCKSSVNSINLNTSKAPNYQESRGIVDMSDLNSAQAIEADIVKPGTRVMDDNNNPILIANVNVHFAATKDSLSRHFNKFGDVLKVVILSDPATGQLKGSAYVEFMRKEAADNALSLDGTSFMSRILKVVKRGPSNQEATSNMTWSRPSCGSPFSAGRFSRAPFPRGVPSAFRARTPVRRFQWKRDAQDTSLDSVAPPSGSLVSPTVRRLTYVRTVPKPDGDAGAT